jgi:hypothetical protein
VINITIDKGEVPTWLIEGALAKGRGTREYILLFRTSAGRIYSSRSHDDGMHWTPAIATQLANPNSKVGIRTLHSPNVAGPASWQIFNTYLPARSSPAKS